MPPAKLKQVNVRVSPEEFELLNASAFLRGLSGAPALVAREVGALVARLRQDDAVGAAVELRRRARQEQSEGGLT